MRDANSWSLALLTVLVAGFIVANLTFRNASSMDQDRSLSLGNFSVSLLVKDLAVSREFYEKLGFKMIAGDEKQNYLILQNENCTIGLFQGMIEKNTLTFNPGWDRSGNLLKEFLDVREIQKELQTRGLTPSVLVDEKAEGPGFMMLVDPDGNPILIDQHATKPSKK